MSATTSARTGSSAVLLLLPLALSTGGGPGDDTAPFSFESEILPLFERLGCSSAYCHGAATGRGGFKLSLFGSDPSADHAEITEEFGGRRLDMVAPENSLLLLKPRNRIEHGGGRRLDRRSDAYGRLARWIEDGAPYERGTPPELSGLRLERNGDTVRAHAVFAGGEQRGRDVTGLARFWSSNDGIAAVGDDGRLTVKASGEAWIFARYGGHTARVAVRRPHGEVSLDVNANGAASLDRAWLTRLRDLGVAPAKPADAHTLVRRLYLDLAGRLPSPAEIRSFLALPRPERVAKTAGALLASPRFAEVWARHVARWFEIPEPGQARDFRRPLFQDARRRIEQMLRDGASVGEIARQTVRPNGKLRPLVDRDGDPRDRAEYVGRTLLGTRIGCARCHDHPLDVWKRSDHLAFSALFADARPDPNAGTMAPGILFHPETREPVEPRLLPVGGTPPEDASRAQAVEWFVVDGGHGMLARAFANRAFAALLGRGLVEPLDDHRLSNPAVHEAVLAVLADGLVRSGHDLRALVERIVCSRLYATGSEPRGHRRAGELFARRTAVTLEPAVLREVAAIALGVRAPAVQVPESPLAAQLALRNGDLLADLLAIAGNQIDAIFLFGGEPRAQLDELYHLLMSRPPADAERRRFVPVLAGAEDPVAAGRELAFALLASREFGSKR